MNQKDWQLIVRSAMSWLVIMIVSGLVFSVTSGAIYSFLVSWNMTGTGMQVETPGRLALITGLLLMSGVMLLAQEPRAKYVLKKD